jgi:hypothetical protein
MRVSYIAVGAALCVGACGGGAKATQTTHPDCTAEGPRVVPSMATLHPGDTLRATVTLPFCPWDPPVVATFAWRSSDTTIATVDSVSGLVSARIVGRTTIIGSLTANRGVQGAMALTVAP